MPTSNKPATINPELALFRDAIVGKATIPPVGDVGASLEDATTNASTLEELEALQRPPVSTEDVFGHLLEIQDVKVLPSEHAGQQGSPNCYAVVQAWDLDTETSVKVTVGGRSALMGLYKLLELGALPYMVEFNKSEKATRNGFYPINMTLKGRRVQVPGEEPF